MFCSAGRAVMSHMQVAQAADWLPSPSAGCISQSHFGCLPEGQDVIIFFLQDRM